MRLYKAHYVELDRYDIGEPDEWEPEVEWPEPEGWRNHAINKWGEDFARWTNGYKPFFPPSDQPIYRSRSAAQRRVDLINRWLGDDTAVLIETETRWRPTSQANRERHNQRAADRIAKHEAAIAKIKKEIAG